MSAGSRARAASPTAQGEATEFDPTDHLSIKEARRADRFSQFAIVAGDEAFAEAGWETNGEHAVRLRPHRLR